MTGTGAPLEPLAQELAGAQAPHSWSRAEYLEQRRYLIGQLTKCHEETAIMEPLIKELNSIRKLEQGFSFKDALAFSPPSQVAMRDQAVHPLKSRIAASVQNLARQADIICRSPEERDSFLSRLERQFEDIQTTLIHQERYRCVAKLYGLSDRIDEIVSTLASFPSRARQHEALLRVMSRSLRTYTDENLGSDIIRIVQHEQVGLCAFSDKASMSISEFLNVLDNLTVETLHVFLDQVAA